MVTITAKHPNATLIRHPETGILHYSEGLWRDPGYAIRQARARAEFRQIDYKRARTLFGDMVPQAAGEWAAVPNIYTDERD